MISEYRRGQIEMFNRLYKSANKDFNPKFGKEVNALLFTTNMMQELNKIRQELAEVAKGD